MRELLGSDNIFNMTLPNNFNVHFDFWVPFFGSFLVLAKDEQETN
jgi:hypothetical protein